MTTTTSRRATGVHAWSGVRAAIAVVGMAIALGVPAFAQEARPRALDTGGIDAFVVESMRDALIPGLALAIVHDGAVIHLQGYGRADPAGTPVTPETPFLIASLSKPFTALAVMQLAEAGAIDLDRPVADYLPGFALADPVLSARITVRHLLDHTSGIPTGAESRVQTLHEPATPVAETVARMSRILPAGAPGEAYRYANVNYMVLGAVIQSVSGLAYEDYLERHVFVPLGMRDSHLSLDATDGGATGFRTWFGFPAPVDLPNRADTWASHGVASSARDLSRLMLAFMNEGEVDGVRVFSREGVAEMTTPSASLSPWLAYGLGWFVTSGSVYHGGELTHFTATMKILPEERLGVVLLFNTSASTLTTLLRVGWRERIESGVINLLYGEDPHVAPPGASPWSLSRQPVAVARAVLLVLVSLVLAYLGFAAVRTAAFGRRLAAGRRPSTSAVIAFGLVHVLVPIALLVLVPRSANATWREVLFYVPDAGGFAIFVSTALLLIAAIRVGVWARYMVADRSAS